MAGSKPTSGITQKDIARELGISTAAVSLGLRNSPEIAPERCRQIQEAAARLGYRLNAAAAQLAYHRRSSTVQPVTSVLAWVNAWDSPGELRAYRQFDGYWNGASAAALGLGYRLEEFRLHGDVTPERLHGILSARSIRGIMLPPQRNHPEWEDFPWEKYSVMRFGRSLRDPACHIVSSDHVSNAMRAFREIRARGYLRIGYLTDEEELVRRGGHLFEAGVLMAQHLVDAAERVPICVITQVPNSGRADLIAEWVRKHRVEAIFTDVAEAPDLLRKAGIRVPEDVAMAVTNVADIDVPAGIDQQPLEIGRVGALLLHSLLTVNECGVPPAPRQVLVDGVWVDGPSLPDRSGGAAGNA